VLGLAIGLRWEPVLPSDSSIGCFLHGVGWSMRPALSLIGPSRRYADAWFTLPDGL